MGKLQDFLLEQDIMKAETTEIKIGGFPFPFVIKTITEGENKAIKKSCTKVSIDPKTRQRQSELDQDLYNNRLVIACCIDPNFKDAELQAKYGVMGAESLIDTLLKPGQFIDLLMAVQEANGYLEDINEQVEEAKN